jgi:plastocyanin
MRSALIGFCLFLVSGLAAQAADTVVTIKNFDFAMDVTVTPGSTVTWKNLDGEPHTVASADGLFRSPALDQNDSYSFKFVSPGVYKYICSIHPRMRAMVTVR